MTRRGMMGLLISAGALLVSGCDLLGGAPKYRFRMTAEVNTPEGTKTGSSVLEVEGHRTLGFGDKSDAVNSAIAGEAVVVDLPGGPIFVLLELPDAKGSLQGFVRTALLRRLRSADKPQDVLSEMGELGRALNGQYRADLPRDAWPMMVRFRDINDPKSVERVDPDVIGVKRIALETTRDPVTIGIEKRLAWLSTQNGALAYDGRMHPGNPEKDLNKQAFNTEPGK